MDSEEFLAVRTAYRNARLEQRSLIVERLRRAGFEVKNRGRAGRDLRNYTSGESTTPFELPLTAKDLDALVAFINR